MFNFFKKEKIKEVELHAIASGKMIPIEEVPDKVFADKIIGDGVGFVYEGSEIYAPCNGDITMVADTKHAIGIKAENDAELLIHVGLDTVSLKGKGLKCNVKVGDKIKQGQLLLQIDREFMKENKVDLTTPMIVMAKEGLSLTKYDKKNVTIADLAMKVAFS